MFTFTRSFYFIKRTLIYNNNVYVILQTLRQHIFIQILTATITSTHGINFLFRPHGLCNQRRLRGSTNPRAVWHVAAALGTSRTTHPAPGTMRLDQGTYTDTLILWHVAAALGTSCTTHPAPGTMRLDQGTYLIFSVNNCTSRHCLYATTMRFS